MGRELVIVPVIFLHFSRNVLMKDSYLFWSCFVFLTAGGLYLGSRLDNTLTPDDRKAIELASRRTYKSEVNPEIPFHVFLKLLVALLAISLVVTTLDRALNAGDRLIFLFAAYGWGVWVRYRIYKSYPNTPLIRKYKRKRVCLDLYILALSVVLFWHLWG